MSSPDTASRAEAPDLRNFSGPLVLVGAGKMGGALLKGWLRFGIDPAQVAVLEPRRRQRSRRSASAACGSIRTPPRSGMPPPSWSR